jgi:hypothetical protein
MPGGSAALIGTPGGSSRLVESARLVSCVPSAKRAGLALLLHGRGPVVSPGAHGAGAVFVSGTSLGKKEKAPGANRGQFQTNQGLPREKALGRPKLDFPSF